MRPVLLTMEGFASYREPTTVDFRGADFFALVGPTGSGKSTVIDALTFALFGSVPRWKDLRTVGNALAPSVNRGVLKLVFEVGKTRYVVARELRRGTQGVTVRNARLERLLDPDGLAEPDDETESIASDGKVSDAVEELLGLTFENFCQCVVLPQGQFADFLQAKTKDRQQILLVMLGAERYERIMQAANSRAALAEQQAAGFAERLAELGDATEDAERVAVERETALRDLEHAVTELLPRLQSAAAEVAEARTREQSLLRERDRLDGLSRPPGTDERAGQRAAANRAAVALRLAVTEAEAADEAARSAAAGGPDRAGLERALEHHREHAALRQALLGLIADAAAAEAAFTDAEQARDAARRQLAERRAAEQASAAEAGRAAGLLGDLEAEAALLDGVSVDPGAGELWEQYREASRSASTLQQELETIEQAAEAAAAAVPSASQRSGLQAALGEVRRLAALTDEEAAAATAARAAGAGLEQATQAVAGARAAAEAARSELDEARRADVAAALRPHLHVGGRCPTCDQVVTAVPPAVPSAGLEAGQARLDQADAALTAALAGERRADRAATQAQERLALLAGQVGRSRETLAAIPLPDGVAPQQESLTAALADAETLAAAAARAAEHTGRARAAAREAARRSAELGLRVGAARAALRNARDPLVPLGAPTLDDDDLVTAWAGLVGWATEQASRRAERLGPARTAAAAAGSAAEAERRGLAEAEAAARRCEAAQLTAAQTRQQARSAVEHARRRSADLDGLLQAAPPEPEAARRLAEAEALEAARVQAAAALGDARKRSQAAEQELAGLDARLREDWSTLRAERDALIASGAPELPAGDLAEAWAALLGWAERQLLQLSGQLLAAARSLGERQAAAATIRAELGELLVAEGLPEPVTQDAAALAREVSVDVARARERAAGERARVLQRREEAAAVGERFRDAEERSQVARVLGDHLRSNKFQRWLAGAALDTLVLDASERLAELSGGQYELSHEKGDFYVVDHADADSRRSVRTLSGGETFQASLALALALSSQLGTFGAGASLDSILLDEGFGTLDAATLDVVAGTLENLAGTDRMVGVVTHVPSLAERIPVRFTVRRDQRTSTVVREDT
jgi:exonuclease SbcC